MHRPNAPVSLADLAAAGVRLRPYEAVTLVRELVLQVLRGEVAGVPSAHVVRLSSLGTVSVEGPVAAGGRPVMRAAQLLETLLPASDAGPQFRVPGGLKLVVARALGAIDLPPYESLAAFADALSRFAATDAAAAIANLVVSWADAVASRAPDDAAATDPPVAPTTAHVQPFVPPVAAKGPDARAAAEPLTISDIRRARRATGLPLATVAERSRIPLGLLRQLEWGYLFNWPDGHYGRTQLVRYARAAGLDEQLVIATITPLLRDLDRAAVQPLPVQKEALELRPAPRELTLGPPLSTPLAVTGDQHRTRRSRMLAALAVPALIALALVPAWWNISRDRSAAAPPQLVAAPARAAATTGADSGTASAQTTTAGASMPEAAASQSALAPRPAAHQVLEAPGPVPTSGARPAAIYALASERAFSPSFASAGTAVFYHAESGGRSSLERADTDGDGSVLRITRIVDDAANNFHVRPSPDGARIAFDSDRDGVRGVYLANADGTQVRRVSPAGYAAVPSWSPDGRSLAFIRAEQDRPKVWNLWTLDLDSGALRQITNHRYGQPWGGSWFPDGRRIAYSHEDRLVIRDLETGKERTFSTPIKGRLIRTPAVSPEGRRIVFQVQRSGTWLLELPGGAMRRILEDPTAEEYTWAPDGKRVAYHSRQSGTWGVWVMAPRDR